MKHRTIGRLAALLFAASGLHPVAAQNIPSPYRYVDHPQSVWLYGGYAGAGRGTLSLGPESGILLGGRYGIRVSAPLEVQGDLSLFSSTRTVFDTIPADTALRTVGEANMNVLALQAALRLNITGARTWRAMQPYILLGGGVALDMAGDAAVEEDIGSDVRLDFGLRFVVQLGGGLDVFLTDRWSLRMEARNVTWKIDTPQPFLGPETSLYRPADEWVQNLYLTAGLAWRF